MERPEFAHLVFASLTARFQAAAKSTDLRQTLDAFAPSALGNCINEGVRRGLAQWGSVMSADTTGAVAAWQMRTVLPDVVHQHWQALDKYQRAGVVDGIMLVATSKEVDVAASIGGRLFGPIGHVVGSAIGGMIVGQKAEESAEATRVALIDNINAWHSRVIDDFNTTVIPSLRSDLAPKPPPPGSPLEEHELAAEESGDDHTSFGVIATLVVILAGMLTAGHWIVMALFFPDQRTVTREIEAASRVPRSVTLQFATPRRGGVVAFDEPRPRAHHAGSLLADTEYQVDEKQPTHADWTPIVLGGGANRIGWVSTRLIQLRNRVVQVPVPEPQKKREERMEKAFHFGRPSIGELIARFGPIWIYVVSGLTGLVLCMSYSSQHEDSLLPFVGSATACAVLTHFTIQVMTFLVLAIWATA